MWQQEKQKSGRNRNSYLRENTNNQSQDSVSITDDSWHYPKTVRYVLNHSREKTLIHQKNYNQENLRSNVSKYIFTASPSMLTSFTNKMSETRLRLNFTDLLKYFWGRGLNFGKVYVYVAKSCHVEIQVLYCLRLPKIKYWREIILNTSFEFVLFVVFCFFGLHKKIVFWIMAKLSCFHLAEHCI